MLTRALSNSVKWSQVGLGSPFYKSAHSFHCDILRQCDVCRQFRCESCYCFLKCHRWHIFPGPCHQVNMKRTCYECWTTCPTSRCRWICHQNEEGRSLATFYDPPSENCSGCPSRCRGETPPPWRSVSSPCCLDRRTFASEQRENGY